MVKTARIAKGPEKSKKKAFQGIPVVPRVAEAVMGPRYSRQVEAVPAEGAVF
jgi:hypothetical protein